MSVPEVTGCIQVDSKLHVKLFLKDVLFPFHNGFVKEKHVRKLLCIPGSYIENVSPIFDKLQKHMFPKKPVYSAKIVRYALLLR